MPISTVLRAATGNCDPYTVDVGVLTVLLCILPKSHAVTVNFCDGHRVTGSLDARSRGHRQFLDGHRL